MLNIYLQIYIYTVNLYEYLYGISLIACGIIFDDSESSFLCHDTGFFDALKFYYIHLYTLFSNIILITRIICIV